MRVALISPYSWTYPGGVTRHIEALAGELLETGHDVRVLAPFDPDDRRTAWGLVSPPPPPGAPPPPLSGGAAPRRPSGPGGGPPAASSTTWRCGSRCPT